MRDNSNNIERIEDDGIDQEFEDSDLNQDFGRILIPSVYQLLKKGHYDEALEMINKFYSTNFYRDKNNQLKSKCDSWMAQVLEKQGKYDEALVIYQSLSQSLKRQYTLFIVGQTDLVRILYKMGKYEEAIIEVEKTLEQQINGDIFDLLILLEWYVEILEACGSSFLLQYRTLVETIANELSVDLSESNLEKQENLSKAIKEISQANRSANRKYSQLMIELNEIEDDNDAVSLLKKYISEESFEFYRNLAIQELEELEGIDRRSS